MSEIVGFACPPLCDAGGTELNGGHIFDGWRVVEWYEEGWSDLWGRVLPRRPACESTVCRKCGLAAVDWDLLRNP